jgi:hypothetical protein
MIEKKIGAALTEDGYHVVFGLASDEPFTIGFVDGIPDHADPNGWVKVYVLRESIQPVAKIATAVKPVKEFA